MAQTYNFLGKTYTDEDITPGLGTDVKKLQAQWNSEKIRNEAGGLVWGPGVSGYGAIDTIKYYSPGGAGFEEARKDYELKIANEIAPTLGITAHQLYTNPQLYTDKTALAKYKGISENPLASPTPQTYYPATGQTIYGEQKTSSPLAGLTEGTQPQTYKVQSGDTLSAIAKKYGVSISDITGYRSGNPNLIYPDEVLTIKGKIAIGTSEQPRGVEQQQNIAEQERIKKEIQTTTDEIQKLTLQKQLQDLKEQIGIGTQPIVPSLADQFDTLMKSGDITALQTGINDLKSQIRNLDLSYKAGQEQISGKLAPMENLGFRAQKLQETYQNQRQFLNNQLSTLQDQYQTKINMIQNLMSLTQQDFQNSSTQYSQQFSQNMQLMQLMNQQTDKIKDSAKSNYQIMISAFKGQNLSQIPIEMQSQLNKLEIQAGLPIGITKFLLDEPSIGEIKSIQEGYDESGKEFMSILTQDPTTGSLSLKRIYTGGVKSETQTDKNRSLKTAALIAARQELQRIVGSGGFVNLKDYYKLRNDYVEAIGDASEFDEIFASQFLSSQDRFKYGINPPKI